MTDTRLFRMLSHLRFVQEVSNPPSRGDSDLPHSRSSASFGSDNTLEDAIIIDEFSSGSLSPAGLAGQEGGASARPAPGFLTSNSSSIWTSAGSTLANRGSSTSLAVMNNGYLQEGSSLSTPSYSEAITMDTTASTTHHGHFNLSVQNADPSKTPHFPPSIILSSSPPRSSPVTTPLLHPSLSSTNLSTLISRSSSSPSSANHTRHHHRRNSTSSINTPLDVPPAPTPKHSYKIPFSFSAATTPRSSPPWPSRPNPFDVDPELGNFPPRLHHPMGKRKPKSQRILALWPLPVVTRVVAFLALLVSLPVWVGLARSHCSAPSYVLYRHEIVSLVLSPFVVPLSFDGIALAGWNLLALGLFEESLAHAVGGGARRFATALAGVAGGVMVLRQGIGHLFSRGVGYAVPSLFFSESAHECSEGLSPYLFALLVIQSLSIDDKYILYYGDRPDAKITLRKVTLQAIMCLVNYIPKNILWWSFTGLIVGFIATFIIQIYLARAHDSSDSSFPEKFILDSNAATTFVDDRSRQPLWRILLSTLCNALLVALLTFTVLLLCNMTYRRPPPVSEPVLNALLPSDPYLFSFAVMTAPRRGDPDYLIRTVDSYLRLWPDAPPARSLYDRIRMTVYTHFSEHARFDEARKQFEVTPRGRRYLRWVREEGSEWDQRAHVARALNIVAEEGDSTYVALVEDDFPMCGEATWRELLNVVYEANRRVPAHCGVFVGTGGSGLIMKRRIALLVAEAVVQHTEFPADIALQKCLIGALPECAACEGTLVTSRTLLMYHIGYNASTSGNKYGREEWQCGWRHPFNGDPDYITL
ncbi:hypothetical protein BC937DRAFT_92100 [Endogone sp. FLAS-F59071]|nr:hypothetical protein BC937DRAFT_92100 [Endogone sp. FLAS-F59071]|eukprot:RUS21620.1 hypothetical protein BC937DRAFT_92100 [Endogone sp. FLAS-F59071]